MPGRPKKDPAKRPSKAEPQSPSPATIENLERKVFDFFTLSQLGKSLISTQDLDDLARIFVASVHETSNASKVALLIYDADISTYKYQFSIGLSEESVKDVFFAEEEGLFWRVLNGGEPFPIRDSAGQYRFPRVVQKFKLDRLDSEIWVPLMVKNLLCGVLTLGKKKDDTPYDDKELSFISQLATQAAVAIDSAILDQQKTRATRALGKKMENLSVLYDVSRAMNFMNDLKKTLLLILDKSRSAVGSQKGSVMLLNKETGELEVTVVRGIDAITERKINDGEMQCTKIKLGEGVAGRVAETGEHIIVDDTQKDKRFKQSAASNVQNMVCLPLVAEGDCIGVMNISNKKGGERFTQDDVNLLLTLAGQVAVTINNANLYHLAITDGLTQLYINRYFRQKLQDEIARSKRYEHPISLIMTDIDHFKKFNDTYGHQQGDAVLAMTAKLFRRVTRETDIACRYGGEEFAIILPETAEDSAAAMAERLRREVEVTEYAGLKGEKLGVTISLGVSTYPQHGTTTEELVEKADIALYASKAGGRNCFHIYDEGMKKDEQRKH
ncbi:MAG: sensor domain-containing diguanylate cyclase [Candidatus Omnitrophota bacterium]|nr:sensor domain-containing diguanylate cyclase [Candidatus Omnitrophota bacterium]